MNGLVPPTARARAREIVVWPIAAFVALGDDCRGRQWRRRGRSRPTGTLGEQLIELIDAILETNNDLSRGLKLGDGAALSSLEIGKCLFTTGFQLGDTSTKRGDERRRRRSPTVS